MKREAGVNCSTPNMSYENVLQWWEKKEPTAENTDGTEMEVEIHIAQLAAAADDVSWNGQEEKGPIQQENVDMVMESDESEESDAI